MYCCFRVPILVLFFCCLFIGSAASQDQASWVPGQYIVKYSAKGIDELKKNPRLAKYPSEEIEQALTEVLDADTVEVLPLIEANTILADDKTELNVNTAVDLIDADLIEYVSPDFIRKVSAVPNDQRYSELWGMSQSNNVDINGPEAADKASFADTSDVIVGVIDTGIDFNHPDLKNNMWTNPQELSGVSGIDDDGNGVIDDIYGYNAINNSGNPFDDNKHGTHCAGTIGAKGNNGIGVAGVVWNVKIMALKFLSSSGSGSDSGAIKAISYAVSMRNRGGRLKVLSNSWGGSGYNPGLLDAINSANSAGILFVAAAGNDNKNTDVNANYPSCYDAPNVLAVAAVNTDGSRASFSNYGANTVDLAAPGVGILSTVPGGGYASLSGTSMATPHISGVAVLAFSQSSQLSAVDVKNILMQSIKPISSLNGLMLKAGIPDASIIASNQLNFAPELQGISKQYISPVTRAIAVPLVAFDREKSPLVFNAIVEPVNLPNAAVSNLDKQYQFNSYIPSQQDYYWKLIIGAGNRQFYILYDGSLYEKISSSYSFIASIGVDYFNNPSLLIDAYKPEEENKVDLKVVAGEPPYIDITAKREFSGSVTITATASDGDKIDTEQFSVEMQSKGVCQ